MSTAYTPAGRTQRGFTLLELLLSVGLLALLLAGMYKVFDDWTQRAINRSAASEMLRVQTAAESYVLANFNTFIALPLNIFTEININDLKTSNYLPSGYVARNAFRQAIRTFKRNIRVRKVNRDGTSASTSSGAPIYIYSIEVLTVSDNPAANTIRIPNDRLVDAAQAGGPRMGVISRIVRGGTTFTGRVTSLFNDWYIPLANISGAGYSAAPDAKGGYLAAYGIVNSEKTDPNDEWLYRVDIDSHPELNRMDTNLRMNDNPVENVGTLVADKVNITGNAVMRGAAQGATADTAQAMTVEQAMLVNGTAESRINMKDTSGGCTFGTSGSNRTLNGSGCTIAGGEVQVISAATAATDATMNLGTLISDGSAITDITNVAKTTNSKGISTFSTLTGDTMTARQKILAPTTIVTGNTIKTTELQASDVTVTTNSSVTGSVVAAKVSPNNGNSFTGVQMDVLNTATFNKKVQATSINASDSLYVKNIRFPGNATASGSTTTYLDTVMNRTIRCTIATNKRTYCEPTGAHTWPTGITETCSIQSNGYKCTYKTSTDVLGTCTFIRSVGASGQAYHKVGTCS